TKCPAVWYPTPSASSAESTRQVARCARMIHAHGSPRSVLSHCHRGGGTHRRGRALTGEDDARTGACDCGQAPKKLSGRMAVRLDHNMVYLNTRCAVRDVTIDGVSL